MDLTGVARYTPSPIADPTTEAAVVAPIIEQDGEPAILFTKRSEQLGDHPGQMSFPGGGREPGDADLQATALREADEEIGLQPNEVEVVGRIDDIETVTRYIVRPFVGWIPDREYTPDEYEVAEIVRYRSPRSSITQTTSQNTVITPTTDRSGFTSSTWRGTPSGGRPAAC